LTKLNRDKERNPAMFAQSASATQTGRLYYFFTLDKLKTVSDDNPGLVLVLV